MAIEQTKSRKHARALLTGGALLAAIAVLLLAVALLSGVLGGAPDEFAVQIARKSGGDRASDWTKVQLVARLPAPRLGPR